MSRAATFAVAVATSLVTSAAVSYAVVRYFSPGAPAALPAPAPDKGPTDVPAIVGLVPDQARQLLEPHGLMLMLSDEREDAKVPAGAICEQRPLPGSRVSRGTPVQAVVSRGEARRVQIPPLAGGTAEAATAQLQAAGLRVGTTTEQPSDLAKGLVISSSPAAGTDTAPGTAVDLMVSHGPEEIEVPDLTHKGVSKARKMLQDAGLAVGTTRYDYDEDYGGNVVLRQNPAAGTRVPKGTKVDLDVNEAD
jgi:eukaryotic-like serine/threonine-protein kinase